MRRCVVIHCSYQVAQSGIAGSGKGIFIGLPVRAGQIVISPDAIDKTFTWQQIQARADAAQATEASVRWFEDRFMVSLDWPDECYVNHSFTPTGIWHLGFIFAGKDMAVGEELTIDYRHLLPEGVAESFCDSETQKEIIGFSWAQSIAISTRQLMALLG